MSVPPNNLNGSFESTGVGRGLILFEDASLLVVHKPAGWNTHAPAPHAGEGVYDWLRHRAPRWATLAILHRLDKETSGVLVFGKSSAANRSLTEQFTQRTVTKKYVLLTDRPVTRSAFTAKSSLIRAGEKYVSRPPHAGGEPAETHFRVLESVNGRTRVEAIPVTGRTHQIRVHAAEHGLPILGDRLYGGTPSDRLCLHAQEISLRHPLNGAAMTWVAPVDFSGEARFALRDAAHAADDTDSYRLVHGAADGWPGWYVDRLGEFLLSQGEAPLTTAQLQGLDAWRARLNLRGGYHKTLDRRVRGSAAAPPSPKPCLGEVAADSFSIRENGLRFEINFTEGYSVGLFLDQRDNRRRFLMNHVAAGFPLRPAGLRGAEVLNTFAYTCGFSVAAARAGARVTSLDLSKKYLEWGRRNFTLNELAPADHDFIFGDVFDWLARLAKKGRRFDVIVLDPPTFSTSRAHGEFRAERDYGELATLALKLLAPDGVLFASTNAARLAPEKFLETLSTSVAGARRNILQSHYVPQPPDFPVSKAEPAYLKSLWARIA